MKLKVLSLGVSLNACICVFRTSMKMIERLSDAKKNQFYNAYTSRERPERKRTDKEESRKKYSFKYFFSKNSDKLQVCKKFFCAILNISQRRVYHFYENWTKKGVVAPTPSKGKYVKKCVDSQKVDKVFNHISSFPTEESHFCRASSQRKYLDRSLSISKMYSLYAQDHCEPVKEHMYRKIFCENFNLLFFKLKKDTCDLCFEFRATIDPDQLRTQLYNDHIVKKDEGYKEREQDEI